MLLTKKDLEKISENIPSCVSISIPLANLNEECISMIEHNEEINSITIGKYNIQIL